MRLEVIVTARHWVLPLLVLLAAAAHAEAPPEIPIRVDRLSPRAISLRAGTAGGYDEIAAVASKRGLLIIDTSLGPTLMKRYLPVIARELGQSAVAYVVNTHSHGDHTNGSQLFADKPIIAHERCAAAMTPDAEDASLRDLTLFRRRLAGFEERERSGTAPLEEKASLSDGHRLAPGVPRRPPTSTRAS